MSRRGLWTAAVVVIVSNVYALGSAGANRRGEPNAVLELTERELRLAPRETENTAMALYLSWTDRAPGEREPGWFDATKLASIGFDCDVPVTADNAAYYRAVPPRSTYAALEYEGEAWRRYAEALPAVDRESGERRPRLVLIDVGNNAGALRARYPDRRRTVIVPATASLAFVHEGTRPPFLTGRINVLYPAELNVPRELRTTIESMPAQSSTAFDPRTRRSGKALSGEPRYRVTVKWGHALEPWIESVQAVSPTR
jgi:hypothetical protein